jgi:translation initiation factor 2 beta subunit (eIF-2beta)/eIF-5
VGLVQWLALQLAVLSLELLLLDSCLLRKAFGRLRLRKRITEKLKAFIPVCNSVEKSLADTDERCCFTEAETCVERRPVAVWKWSVG